jgi:hypothetical protein
MSHHQALTGLIAPRSSASSSRASSGAAAGSVHRDAAPQRVGQQPLQVPRAGLHAAPAHAAGGVGDAVARALLGVALPDLVAVVDDLGPGRDRARRALARALVAASQKRCRPKSIGRSGAIGRSVVTVPLFSRGPRKGLRITSPMRLTSPSPDSSSSGGCSTSPSSTECTRAPAQAPDLLGDDAAHQREAQVGAHALRDADPVVAAGAFHRLVALVEQQVDGIGVVGRQRVAAGVVRVVRPLGHGAQADGVGAEPVRARLQVVRVAHRVGGRRRDRPARVAELQQQQRTQRAPGAGADRALHHVVGVLRVLLHVAAEVAEQRAGEEVGALGKTRHARVVDEGRRLVAPRHGLEREGAVLEVAPGVGVAVEGALERAETQPPGRSMTSPSILARRQRPVGRECAARRHRGQAVALAEVGVGAVGLRQAGGDRQPGQVHIAAARAVAARLEAQHPQVGRQQHRRLRRQQRGAMRLRAGDPVAARLARPRVARELDPDHERVPVMVDRPVHAARRGQHIGQDHVHAGGEAGRLVALELLAQRLHARVADRLGQPCRARQRAGGHHRRVEVVPGGLQVARALLQVVRNLAAQRVDRAVAHEVEHRGKTRHRVHDRRRVGVRVGQRLHRRHCGQVRHRVAARQPLQRVWAQVDRAVAVGEQAHAVGARRSGMRA